MKLQVRSASLAAAFFFTSIASQLTLAANVHAQPSATTASPASTSMSPQPGTLINAANASNYAHFIPPGADIAIKYGLTMRIVPSKRLDWSTGFTEETEKYSAQVGLYKDDYITNYIAGMPLPTVSTTDPKAATKIAYNWHMGPFMPDDFSLAPWGSFAYSGTEPNSFVTEDQNNYVCSHFNFLRFAHRTEVDPRPTLDANDGGVEWKALCDNWTGGPDVSPDLMQAGIVVRYLDPRKLDESYSYNRKFGERRVVLRDALDERCRACHQPYWAYALPKTELYSYRLLGTTSMLACLTADREPAGIVQNEKTASLSEEPFQLRNAYILEMTPKSNEKLRMIVYIDSEAYVWLGAEFFSGNEQTEAAFPFWRSHRSPPGGYLFDLAGEFYVPFDQLTSHHLFGSTTSKLFFRSPAPAHGEFSQKINTGKVSADLFDPEKLQQ